MTTVVNALGYLKKDAGAIRNLSVKTMDGEGGAILRRTGAVQGVTSGTTLTAAQTLGEFLESTGGVANITTLTGTEISTAVAAAYGSVAIGDMFHLTIYNSSVNTHTLVAGVGVTRLNASGAITTLAAADITFFCVADNVWKMFFHIAA